MNWIKLSDERPAVGREIAVRRYDGTRGDPSYEFWVGIVEWNGKLKSPMVVNAGQAWKWPLDQPAEEWRYIGLHIRGPGMIEP